LAGHAYGQDLRRAPADGGQDRFRPTTGLPIATYFSGPKVRWILDKRRRGAASAAGAGDLCFGNMGHVVIWNLTGAAPTGGVHVTDVSNASRTLLMNLETLGLGASESSTRSASRARCCRRSGLERRPTARSSSGGFEGTPIAGDLGDQQAGDVRSGLLLAGRGQEHVRDGQLPPAQHRDRSRSSPRPG
jgi:glycerol kinase